MTTTGEAVTVPTTRFTEAGPPQARLCPSWVLSRYRTPTAPGRRRRRGKLFPVTPAGTSARVRPHLDAHVDEEELLLLADAQTCGGRLVAGEPAGHPAVGGLVASNPVTATTTVR